MGVKQSYAKEQPGADNVFQPPDLDDYVKDAWDIRISIGGAPLEEAFYFTVEDPTAVRLSIEELLDTYALNPERRDRLDVLSYPELPFIQEELIQYVQNSRAGLLDVEFYANHDKTPGPVNLREPAFRYLSVCTYRDHSHDYRVLDLVLVPRVPDPPAHVVSELRRAYGGTFLLLLMDDYASRGAESFREFTTHPPVAEFLTGGVSSSSAETFPETVRGLKQLETEGLIESIYEPRPDGSGPDTARLEITDAGGQDIEKLKRAAQSVADIYDRYDSCSVSPPALGVPGGFDLRVQMMEHDGLEVERAVLLRVIADRADEFFAQDAWGEACESFSFFDNVFEAVAYKTNFSAEVLEALKKFAGE